MFCFVRAYLFRGLGSPIDQSRSVGVFTVVFEQRVGRWSGWGRSLKIACVGQFVVLLSFEFTCPMHVLLCRRTAAESELNESFLLATSGGCVS